MDGATARAHRRAVSQIRNGRTYAYRPTASRAASEGKFSSTVHVSSTSRAYMFTYRRADPHYFNYDVQCCVC